MLKGFVSGEEKDIIRIPMKGKNLARYWKNAYVSSTGVSLQDKNAMSYPVKLKSGDRIRFHTTSNFSRGFATFESFDGTNLSNVIFRGTSNNIDYTVPSDCYAVVWVNLDNNTTMNEQKFNDCEPMLNLGSTALPYEPYGYQNGWEVRDNQDRIIWGREDELQTITGTLPFKGYSLPVKVKSLLGNTVQNGTPAPDNIIVPEFCGVRTWNLCSIPSVSAEINDLTVTANGDTFSLTGTVTEITRLNSFWKRFNFVLSAGDYTIKLVIPRSYQQGYSAYLIEYETDTTLASIGGGTLSEATFTLTNDTQVYIGFYIYNKTLSDDKWIFMLNSGSTALPYEPYGWAIEIEVI